MGFIRKLRGFDLDRAVSRKRNIHKPPRQTRRCIRSLKFSSKPRSRLCPEITSKSWSTLKRIWRFICKNADEEIEFRPLEPELDMDEIKSSNMYSSVPNQIRTEFERINHSGAYLKTKLPGNRVAHIYIVEDSRRKTTATQITIYLRFVVAWLRFASSVASPNCAKELRAYLLLSDLEKFVPEVQSDAIDVVHANTAFTTSCSSQNTIFLFRREEWFKVFIHETFHCMGLDFSAGSENDGSNDRMRSLFKALGRETDVRLYETFCEMWAELVNIMFCLFTTRGGKCLPFSERRFRTALFREQLFSIYQSNKLLRRAGFRYGELFVTPSRPAYKENTPAFSYFVIKSVLLWNVDRFIQWCEKWNDGKDAPMQFPSNHVSDYCDLVASLSRSDSYKTAAETNTMPSYSNGVDCRRTILNTLRMTAIDPAFSPTPKLIVQQI